MAVLLSELVGLELLSWSQRTLEGFGHHWQADLRNECFFFSLRQMGPPLFLPHCGDVLILGQSGES